SERRRAALMFKRIACIEPVPLPIDIEVQDFRNVGLLKQELTLGNQASNQGAFPFVQVKQLAIGGMIHTGVREEDLRGTAFENDRQELGTPEVFARLSREDQRGVLLSPGLQSLH